MNDRSNPHSQRWREMQDAVTRARKRPVEVIEAVATCGSREQAAAALADLLDVDERLAEQLLDLQVAEFLGQLQARS
jgi:hypothetical protein